MTNATNKADSATLDMITAPSGGVLHCPPASAEYWAARNALVDACKDALGRLFPMGATKAPPFEQWDKEAYRAAQEADVALAAFDRAHGGTPIL